MSDPGVGGLVRQEFEKIKCITSMKSSRQFATLLQTAALHEQIAAHVYKSKKAAERKTAQLTGEGRKSRRGDEQSAWSTGHEAVLATREHMNELELSSHHTLGVSSVVQESLKAETEFHARMFERISGDYSGEGVCSGTWIPAWAAAFGEKVHMYEIPPVQSNQFGGAAQFPGTVFDTLDGTRKLEQAVEQESAGCLQLRHGAIIPADQEWYAARFQRAKRGVRGKATEGPADDELPLEQQDRPDSLE